MGELLTVHSKPMGLSAPGTGPGLRLGLAKLMEDESIQDYGTHQPGIISSSGQPSPHDGWEHLERPAHILL